jgi:hypothetical protein
MRTPLFIHSESPEAFLPEEYILALKAKLDEKQRLYAQLPAEIEDLAVRFKAAMVFAPPNFDPSKPAEKTPSPAATGSRERVQLIDTLSQKRSPVPLKPIGWRKALQILLDDATEGVAHKSLLNMAREKYALPSSEGEKGFYNAVSKLINAGQAVKHGNLLFSSAVYEILKKNDELPKILETQRRSGSSAELTHMVLSKFTDGLTGPELRKALSQIPDAPKSLREHGQYVYNILGTMMGTGEVVKENGIYRLSTRGGK